MFAQNWLPWQRPLGYRKKRSRSSSASKTLSFGEKIVKIGPADPEIISIREIIKKAEDKKRKKLTQAKYIARSATYPSGLNKC